MLLTEKMMTLAEAGKSLPGGGKSKTTIYRWATKGFRGVRLECRALGRDLYTSLEALERFTDRLAAAMLAPDAEPDIQPAAIAVVSTPRVTVRRPASDTQSILERAGLV